MLKNNKYLLVIVLKSLIIYLSDQVGSVFSSGASKIEFLAATTNPMYVMLCICHEYLEFYGPDYGLQQL